MKYLIIIVTFVFLCLACSKQQAALNEPDLSGNSIKADSIAITIVHDTIPADSLTFAALTITASPTVYAKYRQVTLTISPIGRFSNDSTTITLPINTNGTAHTMIFSNLPGAAYVSALVGNVTIGDSILFTALIDTIILSALNTTDTADNYSYSTIIAQSKNIKPLQKMQTITFTTNRGRFSNGQSTYSTPLTLDSTTNGSLFYTIGRAYIKDNIAEAATITAYVSGNITSMQPAVITFATAYPDIITVTPVNSVLADTFTSKTNVTATLIRYKGSVTPGQQIYFHDSLNIGFFSVNPVLVDSNGSATTTFTLIDTASAFANGSDYIIGKVITNSGASSVTGKNAIYIMR